jgi:hypothetical protein
MRNNILFLLVSSILFACKPTSQVSVYPLDDAPGTSPGFFYALPRTTLEVELNLSRKVIRKGPYAEYAHKYLGIDQVPLHDRVEWTIQDVVIRPLAELDPSAWYFVQGSLSLAEHDLIARIYQDLLILNPTQTTLPSISRALHPETTPGGIVFSDLSIKRLIDQKTDTIYRTVLSDTSFIRVPLARTVVTRKTLEEKAEEAANFIFELRLRRFDLVTGEVDYPPDGRAFEIAVNELNIQEEEYLSLFTGKAFKDNHVYRFSYTPEREVGSPLVLCYIHPEEGVQWSPSARSKSFEIGLRKEGIINPVTGYQLRQVSKEQSGGTLTYRVPDVAQVELKLDQEIVGSRRVRVFQFGQLVSVPLRLNTP